MKKNFAVKKIIRIICLLMTVGILCIIPRTDVRASGVGSAITGETEQRTNIDEPGSADSREELSELNIANNLTITQTGGNGQVNGPLRILLTLTLIGLVGLALFLTYFIMQPTLAKIYNEAVVPFEAGTITQEEFFEAGIQPLREFMYTQTQTNDVRVFLEISGEEWNGNLDDIPLAVLVPSFILGELREAFIIGFIIYIPFIVIDMVVASTLMSMGMMMLPPTTISMPFKILLFVLADGWNLIIINLVETFYK